MVRCSILTVAFAVLGAEASPCRPTTVSSVAEASSTIASDTTVTTLATTATTALIETTPTALEKTTSTAVAESTTTEAPACVETQVVVNPGFDDSASSKSPWVGSGSLITDGANSAPNAISFVFSNGGGSAQISQTLTNLDGNYRLSYSWGVFSGVGIGAGFGCSITPKIGDDILLGVYPDGYSGWTSESLTYRLSWSALGSMISLRSMLMTSH